MTLMHQNTLVFLLILSLPFMSLPFIGNTQESKDSSNVKSNMEVRAEIAYQASTTGKKVERIFNSMISYLDSLDTKESLVYKQHLLNSNEAWQKYNEEMCKIEDFISRDAAQGGFAFYLLCKPEYNKKRIDELNNLRNILRLDIK